ncbi:MG2 domain-containing protein [Pedosphaera parvula]|uniref:Alpha-2-macroglobulin domain protein n=1 Tax=Pedosphaera parvula (strain Ellin514) TaxID=320771 RepID=B9XNR5_PEDPL|nr:alpha-2-macroglobulin family protein [Pedosphaera parvula]EEF58488.1 alpha-2-macroglobulin domain protein [Pedosphaera parvula Ellin514]
MKAILLISLVIWCSLVPSFGQTANYQQLKAEAEKFFSEGSYAKAHDVYERAGKLPLSTNDTRWVKFRLADTLWRSQAATQTSDNTKFETARHDLEVLVRDRQREDEHDRVWAEVEESLGDFFWTRRNNNDWGGGWPHYQHALDWWAGQSDLAVARERYLKIVWTMAKPANLQIPYYYYGYWGNNIPVDVLDNALTIAKTEEDKAHAHYLLAMTLRNQSGDWDQRQRVVEEFEGAIKLGKKTDWYDDALYNYGVWMTSYGRIILLKDGNWSQEPDYHKALALFQKITSEFKQGETRYWEQAQQQIKGIIDPQLSVGVGNIFLPDSEIQYSLNWRNIKHLDLALYPVSLPDDVKFEARDDQHPDWLHAINLGGREKIKSWSRETNDKGDYKPGNDTVRLDGKLPPGAYILEAKSGDVSARDLILITDAAIVLKSSGKQALVYVANALNSAPLANARVSLWERYYRDNHWHVRQMSKDANKDGIAVFDLTERVDNNNVELFASAISKDRQAFSAGNNYYYGYQHQDQPWRIYAFTDRPAYRPEETVQWKFIARRHNGSVYSTPANQTIEFQIDDPRGTKVKADKASLNAFGSAWGSLDLTTNMPLGEYRVTFWEDAAHTKQIGNATLFRLEEYKLPEFKVSVQTPEEDGKKKTFIPGEKVEVNIQADYYFGGPVSDASVEVVVYQNPFYHYWYRPHDFPWFYEDMSPGYQYSRSYSGNGQIIKRETIKTDVTGKAKLTFDTPRGSGQDYEYRIEARVTDASRREIVGNGTVRVTKQRYYVYPEPEHNLYRPQDKVTVDFKALDANEQPVETEGNVKVTRDYWYEIWLNPEGKEIKGDELKRIRNQSMIFPPPPAKPDGHDWQLKFRGYQHDEILTRTLKTDTNGTAQLTFTPEREGYYRISWTSQDSKTNTRPAAPIQAETYVWVATGSTTELGYRHGGLEIIVDKDTFRVGQKAPVMLSVPTNDRYVLFSVEGEDLYSYQLVHVTGTVKLVELPIEEKHVPNVFLNATLLSDRQIFTDTKQVVVPPTRNFLNVEVKSDREQYQPREQGTFTITTRDYNNKPVPAEVSFGLVDESVYYIQSDYAGDPRQFYYGQKRQQEIQSQSTFNQKSYARLVPGNENQLMDERDREESKYQRNRKDADFESLDRNKDTYYNGMATAQFAFDSLAKSEGRASLAGGMAGNEPAAAAPMLGRRMAKENKLSVAEKQKAPGQAPEQEPAVQVRSDFRSTILWKPDVTTGEDGKATIKVTYPDSLTGWRATARAVTDANQFGMATNTTRTKQPLIVRLQAPRFFLVGDEVTISAIINNNTDKAMEIREPGLDIQGLELKVGPNGRDPHPNREVPFEVKVPAQGEARVDWVVTVTKPGMAKLKAFAREGKYADAMEKSYPIYEHGIEKFISKSGKVRGDDVTVKLNIPKERKPESTSLIVQVTPSMAVTMLDALPYLIDYPYGCTEQTMSRFLPAAITAKTLKDLGLNPEDVMSRVFGGIEQTNAAATHPNGKQDLQKLDEMVKQGLDRLYDFQHADGGWGWWKQGESDHWMTAYVVWGLALARDAKIEIKKDVLDRGADYLSKRLVEEEENPDMQAWMLHALSVYYSPFNDQLMSPFIAKASDNLWNKRDQLNAYTRALFALSAHNLHQQDRAKTLIANLENGVKRDDKPDTSVIMQGAQQSNAAVIGTAHWGEDGLYWRWSDGGIEATAFALRAMLAIDPQNKLIEPVTNWLIKNRRGAQWSNTRDTAITVLAMNDYLRVSGELSPDLEYELVVNGQSIAKKKVSGTDAFNAPSQFPVDTQLIRDGENEIRIVRTAGKGPIYFAANAKFFSLEEPITPAGNEIFVRRQYYKLVGRPTLLKGYVYDRQPLNDGESVKSGERVETVLTIEAKNNYEYLLFEDLKPAGLEAVEVRSGESLYANELKSGSVERKFGTNAPSTTPAPAKPQPPRATKRRVLTSGASAIRPVSVPTPAPSQDDDHTGRTRWVYQELRDRKVALFIDKLPEGVWEIKYNLRAEVPGQFHALPVVGHAMYVPEIRCNGAEIKINVDEAK